MLQFESHKLGMSIPITLAESEGQKRKKNAIPESFLQCVTLMHVSKWWLKLVDAIGTDRRFYLALSGDSLFSARHHHHETKPLKVSKDGSE